MSADFLPALHGAQTSENPATHAPASLSGVAGTSPARTPAPMRKSAQTGVTTDCAFCDGSAAEGVLVIRPDNPLLSRMDLPACWNCVSVHGPRIVAKENARVWFEGTWNG